MPPQWVVMLVPGGRCGTRWGRSLRSACATALLPPSGGDLPEPRFQFSEGYLVPACWLAPWKCCHCGGLALAVPWLSCARHPPPRPTVTLVGDLVEVHSLQQGLCWFWCSASAQEPAAAVWEGACGHSLVFSSSPAGAGLLWLPGHVPLCSLHRCVRADVLCRGLWSKSKVPRSEQRAAFLEQTSLLPLPQHPSFCPSSPSSSIPLPLPGEGQVSPLSPCPRFGLRVPHPIALPNKAPSVGDRAGLGGPGWDVSPRIPMRRGSVFTPGAGGRGELWGLCAARHPPHQLGGRGKEASLQPPGTKSQCGL